MRKKSSIIEILVIIILLTIGTVISFAKDIGITGNYEVKTDGNVTTITDKNTNAVTTITKGENNKLTIKTTAKTDGGTNQNEKVREYVEEPSKIIKELIAGNVDLKNVTLYTLDATREMFCMHRAGTMPTHDNGKGVSDFKVYTKSGTFEVGMNPDKSIKVEKISETDTGTSKSAATYDKITKMTLGDAETADVAYIASMYEENTKWASPVAMALWKTGFAIGGYSEASYNYDKSISPENGPLSEAIYKEATEYKKFVTAYEKKIKENNGVMLSDTVINSSTATNIKEKKKWLGPFKIDYVRGYAKVDNREKVDFGGITVAKLYDQDGNEISSDAWKFAFKSEVDGKKRNVSDADADYEFPLPGEEFYIVIDIDKVSNTTKVSTVQYEYHRMDIQVEAEKAEGTYKLYNWKGKVDKIHCNGGRRVPNGTGWVNQPCSHGSMKPHDIVTGYHLDRDNGTEKTAQETLIIKKVEKSDTPLIYKIPTISTGSSITPNWPGWPIWPHYPNYPDNPDTPDGDLTFTIAGIVWEDTKTGKESIYDGKIGTANSGEKESGVENVEVKLYKHGTSEVVKTTYTDKNGAYVLEKIPTGTYDVGFVYDGMTYTTTQSFASGSASDYQNNPNDEKYQLDSKADETPENRQNFNNKFYEITSEGAKNSAGTKTNEEPLEYDTSNGISKIKTTYSDGKVKKDFKLEARTSDSLNVGYPFFNEVVNSDKSITIGGQTYYANYGYMAYVNLGLQKRPESDFALTKDVYTSTLTINGKEIKYTYNSRANMDNFDVEFKQVPKYKDIHYDRAVYTADWRYRIESYNTNETVDGATLRGLKSEDSELKVFVTYKIKLVNQSEEYSGTINQLVDYFDKDYTLIRSDKKLDIRNENGTMEKDKIVAYAPYYGDKDGNKIGPLDTTEPETYSSNYKKTYISGSGLKNLILQSGDNVYLYLTFEVDKDKATRTVKDGEKSNQIEITSYSTFEKNAITKSKTTGKIDRDSAPGNLDPENSSTLEDDSDIAPTINIYEAKEQVRTIDGVVWEDSRAKGDATKNFLVGNGIREKGEKEINDVTVELVELIPSADGSETYYYVWQSMSSGSANYQSKDLSTGETKGGTIDQKDGAYKFSNYIPGDYIVRFRYGDTTKTVKKYNGQDYKSTTYWGGEDINNEWYNFSSTRLSDNLYSDAKDNADRRKEVINYSTKMKNDIAKVLSAGENDSNYNLLNELISKTQMYATTAKIKVEVEYNTTKKDGESGYNGYNIQNIDFGLEERPKAKLELKKEVESIKITLADGSTLIDTAAGIKKNVQTIPESSNSRKKLHIYMDEEVMQGANIQIAYKINVTNKSEIDYTALTLKDGKVEGSLGDAYYTGKIGANDKQVTTSIDKIADYVDKSIVYRQVDNEGRNWEDGNMTKLVSDNYIGYITSDDKADLSKALTDRGINQVLLNESKANERLKPGENVTYDLLLTKTISSSDSDDDLSYSNMAEVLQYTNTVGRRADIPGDQDPAKAKISTETDADFSEDVVITPPTGENRAHYFVLTGVILVIIAGGVFVIKKKVLDK